VPVSRPRETVTGFSQPWLIHIGLIEGDW
jgi:hypothetical protein